MYQRTLSNAHQTRRFIIQRSPASGWDVRDEQDSRVLRAMSYRDWHRVERARDAFAREAAALEENGWTDYSTNR